MHHTARVAVWCIGAPYCASCCPISNAKVSPMRPVSKRTTGRAVVPNSWSCLQVAPGQLRSRRERSAKIPENMSIPNRQELFVFCPASQSVRPMRSKRGASSGRAWTGSGPGSDAAKRAISSAEGERKTNFRPWSEAIRRQWWRVPAARMSTSVTCEAERTSSSSAARNSSFRPSPKAQARSSRAGRVVSGTVQNLVQALVGQRIFRGEPEVF